MKNVVREKETDFWCPSCGDLSVVGEDQVECFFCERVTCRSCTSVQGFEIVCRKCEDDMVNLRAGFPHG